MPFMLQKAQVTAGTYDIICKIYFAHRGQHHLKDSYESCSIILSCLTIRGGRLGVTLYNYSLA